MLGTDLLVQPPSPKAQKLTSTSNPKYNNFQDSPFWNSPSNLPVDKKTYSTTTQQPAQYSPNAIHKKDIENTLRAPQIHQQTLISAGADKHASAHKPQGFYYTPELESREHRPVGYVLPRSSAQEANNNTSASDTSSLINSVFNKQK